MTRLLAWLAGKVPVWVWIVAIAALSVATGVSAGYALSYRAEVAEVRLEAEKARAERLSLENSELIAREREISRLINVNQEVQSAYNEIRQGLASSGARYAAAAGVRDKERKAIVAATSDAGTCDREAALSEEHLAGLEQDANQMGELAVRALAKSEALQRTLQERRADVESRRKALTPPKNEKE